MSTHIRTSNKLQRSVRDMVVYQARSVKGMMLAHSRGLYNLNMARVARDLEWCWDTYSLYEEALGPFQAEAMKAIEEAEEIFEKFDFDKVRNNEDEISKALDAYHAQEIAAVMEESA